MRFVISSDIGVLKRVRDGLLHHHGAALFYDSFECRFTKRSSATCKDSFKFCI